MLKQQVILAGGHLRYHFEREAFSWREGEGGWPVYARALICPYCRDNWGTLAIEGQNYFCCEEVSCELCNLSTPRHSVPGSLLDSYTCNGTDWGLIDVLPEPLLRREFQLHLRSFP